MNRTTFLRVGDIARLLSVTPETVKRYERRGAIPRAIRSPLNGYRVWRREDIDQVLAGFTNERKEAA